MRQAAKRSQLTEGNPVAPESAARLSVSLVGRLACRFNGRPGRTANPEGRRGSQLSCAVEAKQESRERLVGLLWSRSDEEKARASLRQVVRELRSAFEEAGYHGFVAEG
jgi:DNA-binding SARP family transcriptional activator